MSDDPLGSKVLYPCGYFPTGDMGTAAGGMVVPFDRSQTGDKKAFPLRLEVKKAMRWYWLVHHWGMTISPGGAGTDWGYIDSRYSDTTVPAPPGYPFKMVDFVKTTPVSWHKAGSTPEYGFTASLKFDKVMFDPDDQRYKDKELNNFSHVWVGIEVTGGVLKASHPSGYYLVEGSTNAASAGAGDSGDPYNNGSVAIDGESINIWVPESAKDEKSRPFFNLVIAPVDEYTE